MNTNSEASLASPDKHMIDHLTRINPNTAKPLNKVLYQAKLSHALCVHLGIDDGDYLPDKMLLADANTHRTTITYHIPMSLPCDVYAIPNQMEKDKDHPPISTKTCDLKGVRTRFLFLPSLPQLLSSFPLLSSSLSVLTRTNAHAFFDQRPLASGVYHAQI